MDPTVHQLTSLVQHTGAALLVDDEQILCDQLVWLADLVEFRGGDPREVAIAMESLVPMVLTVAPHADPIVTAARAHLAERLRRPGRPAST